MDWDQIKGNWKQFTGTIRQKWGELTDDDIERIAGNRDQLAGKIQQRYGISKQEAQKQIDEFEKSL